MTLPVFKSDKTVTFGKSSTINQTEEANQTDTITNKSINYTINKKFREISFMCLFVFFVPPSFLLLSLGRSELCYQVLVRHMVL